MTRIVAFLVTLVLMISIGALAQSQSQSPSQVRDRLEDIRKRIAHPPFQVRPNATTAPTGYSPAQISHAYGLDTLTNNGAGQIIAIVDAFDDPTIASDLQTFTNFFGLPAINTSCNVAAGPHPCFQKVFAQGRQPRTDSGWALEISLDVEWAHAVAPSADILLVESSSNSLSNLLGGVDTAVRMGAKVVSMSWGSGEFAFETFFDSHFNVTGVTFTASSGDNGGAPLWPAVSPFVVAVGGTTLPLDASGNLTGPETAWSGSNGDASFFEAEPGYQNTYPIPDTGGARGVPDVSYVADPNTGVSVYDTTPFNGQSGWFQIGGTSVGAPQWAAIIGLANQGRSCASNGSGCLSSSNANFSPLYNAASPPLSTTYNSNYRDITAGSNVCCAAGPGYDFVTGLGSPLANSLVSALVTSP